MQGKAKVLLVAVGAAQLLLVACQDTTQSPQLRPEPPSTETPGASSLAPLDLVYVCGNKFLATNKTPSAVQLEYRVAGTNESGILVLREGPGGDPGFSETELETKNKGIVELYQDGERVARRSNGDLPCGGPAVSAAVGAVGNEATVGMWSAPFPSPIIAVHLHLLRNGKVLSWGKFGNPYIWDPATKAFTAVPSPVNVFCGGHAYLPDGRLLVSGGHISDDHGLATTTVFNPGPTPAWSTKASMAKGRWYPTVTTLANGQVVTIGGNDQNAMNVPIPEVWTGSSWRPLTSASRNLPYYPRTLLAPNGSVFYAGELRGTYYLSTSGTGAWTWVADRLYGGRDYGSAVMYQPGKILYAGGGYTTNTAEVIDLNQPIPTWQWTNSMAYARRHLNATILPDGTVLVTGGTSGTTFNDEANAVLAAELWDPASGTWTTLASNSVPRVYHSASLLLKDGRVLHTGGGDASGAVNHYDAELFSPPYLFKGPRPKLTQAPTQVNYGQDFFVATSDPNAIARVTLVRLGSVTHAFDMNQRFNELAFTRVTGGLTVSPPASVNLAPPGHYMLFVLNASGVPSWARIFRLR